jgi:hypothetical protein
LDGLTIHLISHNHWDREWIFTAKYTNRSLAPFFDNLFQRLDEQPSYRFVLAPQRPDDDDLHPCPQPRREGSAEPDRRAGLSSRPERP